MRDEQELRETLCEVGRRMYQKNFVAATDGNISARLGHNRFLCTPSGVSKGSMAPEDLLVVDEAGNNLGGKGRVTTEFFTHLACYEERPDINAACHGHPPKAVGFTLAGLTLEECVLPELVMSLGSIPTAPYATPGTKEGYEAVRKLIQQCDALLLDRHGALTVGADLYDAYYKMERIEHAAETLLAAHLLGRVRTLSDEEVERLMEARASYGCAGLACIFRRI